MMPVWLECLDGRVCWLCHLSALPLNLGIVPAAVCVGEDVNNGGSIGQRRGFIGAAMDTMHCLLPSVVEDDAFSMLTHGRIETTCVLCVQFGTVW